MTVFNKLGLHIHCIENLVASLIYDNNVLKQLTVSFKCMKKNIVVPHVHCENKVR